MKRYYWIVIFKLCIVTTTFAQVIDTTLMDKMNKTDLIEGKESAELKVVSASRSDAKLTDLPLTILVITQEEIQQNGYITLVDVLKSVGGIRVSQPGNGELGEMFLMRGLIGNTYTKILLNSIPLQPSVLGAIAIAEQLPIAQAERIEIIFGPSSAVYGADAMAGVINIITKSPQKNSFVQANAMQGEYGYRHVNFMAGGKFGKDKQVVKYTLYGNNTQRDDLNTYFDKNLYNPLNTTLAFTPEQVREAYNNPDMFLQKELIVAFPHYQGTTFEPFRTKRPQESHLMGVQLEYKNLQFSYNEMYRQNNFSIGVSPLYFNYNNPHSIVGDKIQRFTLSFNQSWQRWSLTTNLSYNRYRSNPASFRATTYNYNAVAYNYSASDDIFAEVLARYTTTKKWEYTLGGSLQVSSILPKTDDLPTPFDENDYKPFANKTPKPTPVTGSFGFNPYNAYNAGVFIQTLKVAKKWAFIGGLRIDYNSQYSTIGGTNQSQSNQFNANIPITQLRLSYQYNLTPKFSLRTSLGSGIKAPAPNDKYVSTAIPIILPNGEEKVSYQQIPNLDLAPELIGSFEVGMRYIPNKKFYLETILYTYTLSQRITATLKRVDSTQYPNAINLDDLLTFPVARTFANDAQSTAILANLQILAKYKNLAPKIALNLDASIAVSSGAEKLPDDPLNPNDGGTIDNFRTQPNFMGHLNLDAKPFKNWYIRIENVLMNGWTTRFVFNNQAQGILFNQRVAGYHNMDILLRYTINKNFQTFIKINNVLNKNFGGIEPFGLDVDLRYNPQYLRMFRAGFNFKLD